MESVQILEQVHGTDVPGSWIVLPLQRNKVFIGVLGWLAGTAVSTLLLILMVPVMIPHNYQTGVAAAIISTIMLGLVVFVLVGSLWYAVRDILRLLHPQEHVIIITPNDFVKQNGKKVIHVPMEHIRHVTARGKQPVDRSMESAREDAKISSAGDIATTRMFGRGFTDVVAGRKLSKRARTPNTLAFIDGRTDTEVIVLNDLSFGDVHAIGTTLNEYAASAQGLEVD
jgi:hypothetical protein